MVTVRFSLRSALIAAAIAALLLVGASTPAHAGLTYTRMVSPSGAGCLPAVGGTQYTSIYNALSEADPGDTVFVCAGTYSEPTLYISDDNVSLLGPGSTAVDDGVATIELQNPYNTSVIVQFDHDTVSGLTFDTSTAGVDQTTRRRRAGRERHRQRQRHARDHVLGHLLRRQQRDQLRPLHEQPIEQHSPASTAAATTLSSPATRSSTPATSTSKQSPRRHRGHGLEQHRDRRHRIRVWSEHHDHRQHPRRRRNQLRLLGRLRDRHRRRPRTPSATSPRASTP